MKLKCANWFVAIQKFKFHQFPICSAGVTGRVSHSFVWIFFITVLSHVY